MKANIHPKWYPEARVICACGNMFTVGSTKPEISVEVCSRCHPFFTGESRYIDTMGRVEKFQKKQSAAAKYKEQKKVEKQKKEKKKEPPRTLKEMLLELKRQ